MKHALITGATSGIGKALALFLASKGYSLCLTGRHNLEDLEQVPNAHIIPCDLSEDRTPLVEYIRANVPDLVINNAGFGTYGSLISYDTDVQLDMAEVMVDAVLELTMESAKALRAAGKKGTIMNISSAASFVPMPYFANYSACKAYSRVLSEALDYELREHGIRVLCSCPGVVRTGFRKRASGGKDVRTPFEMTALEAVIHIWRQIETGKTVEVFDWKYRWMIRLLRVLPRGLVNRMIETSMKKLT
jgi:short-subunit dehydrogenase